MTAVARRDGPVETLQIGVPVQGQIVSATIDGWSRYTGVEPMHETPQPGDPPTTKGPLFTDEKPHTVVVFGPGSEYRDRLRRRIEFFAIPVGSQSSLPAKISIGKIKPTEIFLRTCTRFHLTKLELFPPGNGKQPAKERLPDGKSNLSNPAFEQWMSSQAKLRPEQRVEAVVKKLQEVNPGFDGKEMHQDEQGIVTEFEIHSDAIVDISPVRAFAGLKQLDCSVTRVADLSPLKGMPLTVLIAHGTAIQELAPLSGMPLDHLDADGTKIDSLLPLRWDASCQLGHRRHDRVRPIAIERHAAHVP